MSSKSTRAVEGVWGDVQTPTAATPLPWPGALPWACQPGSGVPSGQAFARTWSPKQAKATRSHLGSRPIPTARGPKARDGVLWPYQHRICPPPVSSCAPRKPSRPERP